MTGSSAGSSHRSHTGAHPSCKICLKNAWMRPAGPLAAFHLRFPTRQLRIGLLSCKRQGQLLAQPTVPGSVRPNPWDCHQNGHFGGFEAHRVGIEPLCHGSAPCWEVASLLGSGVPMGVGMLLAQGTGCLCWFWASCVLCSNKHESVLVGNPSFPKGLTAPVAFNL